MEPVYTDKDIWCSKYSQSSTKANVSYSFPPPVLQNETVVNHATALHNVEANICKYSPEQPSSSTSGGRISLVTLMRSPLFACNFQSLSGTCDNIQPKENDFDGKRENNCLQLSFNDVSKTRSWSFILGYLQTIGVNNMAV